MPGEMYLRCLSCGTLNRAPYDKAGMTGKCGRCKAPFTVPPGPQRPKDVDDADFHAEVERSDVPVLLEFWSPSCGYCIRMEPVIDELARELTGRVTVARMDVSRNARIPSMFQITGTPAFVLMKNGREAARVPGAVPKEQLVNLLMRNL